MLFLLLAAEVIGQSEEQIINCNMPDTEDGVAYENQDEEPMAMIEESPTDPDGNLNQLGIYFPLKLLHVSVCFVIVCN